MRRSPHSLSSFLPHTPCRPQDASTASLVWTLALMADHPEVLARVRAEQADARPDLSATLTAESLAKMPYTRQVRGEPCRCRAICSTLRAGGDCVE